MRVEITDDNCWLWKGYVDVHGYAILNQTRAHRAVYELFVDRVPAGYHVHHRCGNKSCVNPIHLEALPASDHIRSHQPHHDQCIWGHPFDEKNTYITRKGDRQCRACKARRERERQRRLRLGNTREDDVGVVG